MICLTALLMVYMDIPLYILPVYNLPVIHYDLESMVSTACSI